MASTNSCTGACCTVFPINTGGSARDYFQARADGGGDIAFIGNMIFPLRHDEARARWELLNPELSWDATHLAESSELFSCRHWDTVTRKCREYERRPSMCSLYPYARPCPYCGYLEAKAWWDWDPGAGGWRMTPQRAAEYPDWQMPADWHDFTWDGELLRPLAQGG